MENITNTSRRAFASLQKRAEAAEREAAEAKARVRELERGLPSDLKLLLAEVADIKKRLTHIEALRASKPEQRLPEKPQVAVQDAGGKEDMLCGTKAIADHLGIRQRQVLHLVTSGRLPSFNVGKSVCARRSTLVAWVAEQEQKEA